MPWHIDTAHADCRSGYAVVKDDDGSVEGCHRTRREALAQIAALNIAEAERAAAKTAIIVDIDGTLLDGDEVNEDIAKFVREQHATTFVAIVTARLAGRRNETVVSLREAEVPYDTLRMRPDDSISGPRWKGKEAARLGEEYEVVLAIDNDPAARTAYENVGVARVIAPENLARAEERQEGYAPTDGMVSEARRGLEWRAAYGRGGTAVGVARARDIVNRRRLSRNTVARMASYFARHAIDRRAQGFRPGEPGYPSAGRIAWALWGGDPGVTFARAILSDERSLHDADPSASIDGDRTLG